MKKKEKGYWKKVVAAFFMTLVVAYALAAALFAINDHTNFQENILDFDRTFDWVLTTDFEMQMVLGVLSVVFFGFVLSKVGEKKGFQNASDHGVHGTSRWGEVEELKKGKAISSNNQFGENKPFKTLKVEDGIVLGKTPNKNELLILPENTTVDNSNVFLIGASGSGKGQSFVFNNIINNTKKTMIITDPKGELYHATHQIKRDQGFEVFQIDFLNLDQAKYNPLDYIIKDIDAKKIAEAIAKNSSKDGKEDFFFTTARDLLTGLIIYCKSVYDNANIPVHVKGEFYRISEDENYLRELCEDIGRDHPAYAYLKDASVSDGKTRTSILSSFAQQTAIFSLKDVESMTASSDFNFHDFQERKSILYVKIPMKSNPVEALTATFFDQLISVLYDIADKNYGVLPIKTMFLLDEFANLGKINDYEGTLSTCRGLGMEMITIVQDLAQLENKYGKEIGRTIINNHDTKLFLRTGDVETAKYFSGLAGDTTARMKTTSNSQSGGIFTNGNNSKSTQEQYVKRPLITEGELMTVDKNTCYLFVSGYYPLKLEKAWQYVIYGDFLFGKDRKPNYLNYREKYLRFLDKEITPIYDNFKKDEGTTTPKIVDSSSTSVSIEKIEQEPKEDIIITKVKPSESKQEIEEIRHNDKFDLMAQEFLMKNFAENQHDEQVKKNDSIEKEEVLEIQFDSFYEDFGEIDAEKEIMNIVSKSSHLTEETINDYNDSFASLNTYTDAIKNEDQTFNAFVDFVDMNDAKKEINEDEAILMGE
ncbi:VirD4-like conjugal transfer protein, CD1115 family [Heyndrickxia sporothermodurans]|uniref:Type IV secretory system conjugative DNA transfer family protein n=2 Tax=Heyndrickxia sporothermodurans TaxID=46224 RepID=A0AB37HIB9_9BACI|nr:type IV secretory system conjugative DNA transfer family protein [Heyndrickxia sporothermodurans]MBL5782810.1 type IV secretory system conjugative DNA transfer family protein [Heyndrickxia sporothermodurans]MBL5804039.1 type IV secretory system conjugative DNA transfer family protein [Heyndrickxia sporothermodurans]MBL5867121.1 type IV secretory system conjugative DNA transfer family protein [Heyndrickxia sporothermodurans]MBL7247524.1 type IV secretory system conjugative DNA transfer family